MDAAGVSAVAVTDDAGKLVANFSASDLKVSLWSGPIAAVLLIVVSLLLCIV